MSRILGVATLKNIKIIGYSSRVALKNILFFCWTNRENRNVIFCSQSIQNKGKQQEKHENRAGQLRSSYEDLSYFHQKQAIPK